MDELSESSSLSTTHILDLPDEVLRTILKQVGSYRKVRTLSMVCKRFKTICGGIIKCGYIALEKSYANKIYLPETIHYVLVETYKYRIANGFFEEKEIPNDAQQPPEDPENPAPEAANIPAAAPANNPAAVAANNPAAEAANGPYREMAKPVMEHYIAYTSRLLHTFKQFAVGFRFFKAFIWSTSIYNNDFTSYWELVAILDYFYRGLKKFFSLSSKSNNIIENAKLVQRSLVMDMRMRTQSYIEIFHSHTANQNVAKDVFGSTMVALLDTALDAQCEEVLIYEGDDEEDPRMRMKFKMNHCWLNLQNLVARSDITAERNRDEVLRFIMRIISKTNYKYLDRQYQLQLASLGKLLGVDDVTELDVWEVKLPETYTYQKLLFEGEDWISYEDLLAQSILRGQCPLFYKYDNLHLTPYQKEHCGVEFDVDMICPLEFLSKAMWKKRQYPVEKPSGLGTDFEMVITSYDSHSEAVLSYGLNRYLDKKCKYRVTLLGVDADIKMPKKGRQLEEQEKRKFCADRK